MFVFSLYHVLHRVQLLGQQGGRKQSWSHVLLELQSAEEEEKNSFDSYFLLKYEHSNNILFIYIFKAFFILNEACDYATAILIQLCGRMLVLRLNEISHNVPAPSTV